MRPIFTKALLLTLAMLPVAAKADTFSFSAVSTDGGYTGSGALIANSNGDGSYTVTSISGTGISGLLPENANVLFANDNLLLPSGSRLLDVNGIAFSALLGGVGYDVNLYSTVAGYQALALDSLGDISPYTETFTLAGASSVTPEPSSMLLLGSGFVGLANQLHRRRKVS